MQLLDLVDSQSTWDTHRSNEEKQIHTKLKVYYLFSFSHVYGPIQLLVCFRYAKKHRRHAIPRVRFLKGRSSRAACRARQRLVGIRKRDDRVAARLQVAITRVICTALPVVGL